MTPRQFSVLLRRHKQRLRREQCLIASLQCVTANFSICRPKEPFTVEDFMPTRKRERTEDEIAEDFAAKMASIAFGPGVPAPLI
jgi:hypothetical protein